MSTYDYYYLANSSNISFPFPNFELPKLYQSKPQVMFYRRIIVFGSAVPRAKLGRYIEKDSFLDMKRNGFLSLALEYYKFRSVFPLSSVSSCVGGGGGEEGLQRSTKSNDQKTVKESGARKKRFEQ